MNKLIIATHGYMAKGIKSALAIIAGDVSNVIDINAFTEECPNLDQRVAELLSQYQDDEILVLTDVYFGGVNQAFMRAQRDRAFPENIPAAGALDLAGLIAGGGDLLQAAEEQKNLHAGFRDQGEDPVHDIADKITTSVGTLP